MIHFLFDEITSSFFIYTRDKQRGIASSRKDEKDSRESEQRSAARFTPFTPDPIGTPILSLKVHPSTASTDANVRDEPDPGILRRIMDSNPAKAFL